MRWVNHKVTTFSVILLITHDFVSSIVAAIGSIIPDAIEGYDYHSSRWKKNHRKISHWLAGYLIIALVLGWESWIRLKKMTGIKIDEIITGNALWLVGFYITVGCVMHIIEDSLSGTIPVIHPRKRVFTLGIIKTGSISEYILSYSLLGLSLLMLG